MYMFTENIYWKRISELLRDKIKLHFDVLSRMKTHYLGLPLMIAENIYR